MNKWKLFLDKLLGNFTRKELVAYVEDEIFWTDLDITEKITTLLFQDQYNRRYIEIIRYGNCKRFNRIPKSIGEIKIWQNGGDFPFKAKRISNDIRKQLKLIR